MYKKYNIVEMYTEIRINIIYLSSQHIFTYILHAKRICMNILYK